VIPRTLPFRGVTNSTSFRGQPADFAPFGSLLNFLPNDTDTDRLRGGQRPGLSKLLAARVASGQVQAIQSLALSSQVTGYVPDEDTCEDIETGSSRNSGVLSGNAWMLDDDPSMFRDFDMLPSDFASGSKSINAVCWDPDNEHAYLLMNYTSSAGFPRNETAIFKVRKDTGATVWETQLGLAFGNPIISSGAGNTVETDGIFVYIAEGPRVFVLLASDGAGIKIYDINGWANEAVEARIRTDGKLLVAFRGSSVAGTLYNGQAILPNFGSDFRAGVCLFDVDKTDMVDPLTWTSFGPQLSTTDPWFETTGGATNPHGYFRMSEHLPGAPRGSTVEALAVTPDNGVVIARRNKAFGPNWAYSPDPEVPFITVFKLDENGYVMWSVDTNSKRDSHTIGSDTYYSDRWSTDPSIIAVAVGDNGDVYVAGDSHPRAAANVFRLDSFTGAIVAQIDLGAVTPGNTIRQAAIDIMPKGGLVAVAGVRHSDWPNAGTRDALLWYLSPGDLSVVRHYDLGAVIGGASAIKFNDEDEAVLGSNYI